MPTEILISSDPWENRVAILENGSLAEIYIEREEKVIGSIYKGKVQNVLPGMGASFIDIGIGRNAFLYVDDINKTPLNIGDVEITQGRSGWTIGEKVNRGDEILVQIVKEPRGLKGARVSTNISLPGRYLILMPTGKFSGVSRKIESADERNRLKNVMKRIRPEEMATIVRTAAAGVSDAELIADLGVLIRMWHGILENYKSMPSPSLVHKDMNLVFKAARDFITPEVDRVLVDNQEECEKLRDFMRLLGPQYVDRISYYPQGKALFRDYKVDEEITRLMRPKVNLPSGGSLVIETTEALTVIDVNSGKYAGGKTHEDTILHTNLEAAAEIARQVRLRDIGGIIVSDFIDMNSEANRTKVLNVLETGLRRDRTRTTIQSFSALGLLEFTRKRVGKDLSAQLRAHCPTCRGLGNVLSPETVTIETFRAVDQHHHHGQTEKPLSIVASPTVGAHIRYWHEDALDSLADKTARQIDLVIDPSGHPERTHITADPNHLPAAPTIDIKLGDEFDAEIMPIRMPNPTSGVVFIGGNLIEVENAAGAVGSTLGIKIIEIDEETGDLLAEPRGPQANPDRKRRRRKRGRAVTPADQAEELRELAEEAARIAAMAPPAPIATPAAQPTPAPAPAAAPQQRPERQERQAYPAQTPAPTERGGNRQRFIRRQDTPVAPRPPVVAEVPQQEDFFDPAPFFEETQQQPLAARTPRFQPRPRRPGMRVADGVSISLTGAEALDLDEDTEDDDIEDGTPLSADAVPFGEGQRRRRRRRRRGRGRGPNAQQPGLDGVPTTPENPAVPNRSIFRVAANGSTEPTGQVAPPEPSRAISPWRPRNAQVAVDAPPPSLLPQEGPPVARPARRRGRPPKNAAPTPAPQLTTTTRRALPPAPPIAPPPAPAPAVRVPAARVPVTPPRPVRLLTPAAPAPVAAPAPKPVAPVPAAAPRRRGRPPKIAPVVQAAPALKAAPVVVKAAPAPAPVAEAPRKRGRPPKVAAPVAAAPAPTPPPVKAAAKAPAARTTRTRKPAEEPAPKPALGRRKKSA